MKRALPGILVPGMMAMLLAVAGCAAAITGPEGEVWQLESYGNGETPAADQTVTAEFDGERVTGNAGCNNYFGAYELDGAEITIGPMGSTEMWCEGAMDLEQAFLSAMGQAESFEVQDGELQIDYPGGRLVFSAR